MDGTIPPPPAGYTLQQDTMADANPSGLIAPGNIDLSKRPIAQNADGSYSTVRSISVDQDGRSYLIPTVVNGVVVSNDQAIQHFQKTGENLGQFKTWQDADKYAETLHNEQAKAYDARAGQSAIPPPPPGYQIQSASPDQMPTAVVHASDQQPEAQPRSFGQDLGRAAIMTGRNVLQGVLALPAMVHDATVMPAYNAIAEAVGSDSRINPGAQQIDANLNAIGVPNPQPENATERVVSGIDRGLGGLLTGAGAGGALAGSTSAAARGVGGALTSNLGAQTAATTLGVGSSELAREADLPASAQIATGLIGGMAPAAVGGVRGAALGTVGKLLGKPSQEVTQLGRQALDAGIPLKASQVSASKVGKLLDSVSGQVPFSGAQHFQNTQQQAFNRAVSRAIGENSDAITPQVFSAAKQRIGKSYDDLASRINPAITPTIQTQLSNVLKSAQQFGAEDSAKAVASAIARVKSQIVNGALPGQAYKSLDSELGGITKNGGEKGQFVGQVREILRKAFTSSASPADKAQMALANKQYANLKTIEPLVAKDSVEGNISPAQLLGRVTANKAGKSSMAAGNRGDLGTLANVGQKFLKSQIPDSGTAQRAATVNALRTVGTLGTGAAAGSLLGPLGSALTAGSTLAGSRGLQSLLKNPSLVNALLGNKSPSQMSRLLMLSADPATQSLLQSGQ